MQYNTALGFLLSGLGLWGLITNKPKMAQTCGGVVSILGILTLIQYSTDINLHIDEFFMEHNILVGTSHPGRMAPNTALCFTLSGLVLVLACAKIPQEVPNLISILVVSLGFIALTGYIIDLEYAYGWGSLTRMALHTTAGFLILGSGLVIYTWQKSLSQNRLPVATGLIVLALTLTLWQTLATREKQQIRNTIEQTGITVRDKLTLDLNSQTLALQRMGNRWNTQKPTYAVWESDANAYVQDMPNLQAIEWVDKNFIVQWIVPLKGNEAAQNLNLAFEEKRKQALLTAKNNKDITFTDPIDLIQGDKGFLVYIPLFPNGQFDGFILGVYNIPSLINHTINPKILANYHITLSLQEEPFYASSSSQMFERQWLSETILTTHNLNWIIQACPKNIWQLSSFVPELALGVGLFICALCSISVFYAQQSIRRSQELNIANTQLQENETRFRTLTSNAPVGIYQTDPHGACLFVNERWCNFTGITTEDARGKGWINALHPDDKEDVLNAWRWAVDADQEFKKEYRFLQPSGQIVWVSGNAIKLTDENENAVGYIGTVTDITNQKLAEEALQLNRQELNQQVNTQSVLAEINRAVQLLRHPNDLQNVTEVCAAQLKVLGIGFNTFSINHLVDEEKTLFEIHTMNNAREYQKEIVSRPGIYREFKIGQILHRRDLLNPQYQEGLPEDYLKNHTINNTLDIRTILQIPFSKGTVTLRNEQPYAFSDDDVNLLQNITEILAVGITRVEDLTKLEESRLELTISNLELDVTNQIVEAINANLDFDQIYQVFVQKIDALFDFDETALWLMEDTNTYIRYHTLDSPINQISPRIKTGTISEDTAFGHVLKTGEPHIHANWQDPGKFPIGQDLFDMGLRTDIIVPIKYQNEIVGAFTLNSRIPNKYTEKDIEKLDPLMDQLGIAIHNAQLLKNLDLKNAELAEQTQNLLRTNEELEQFAYVASHDLQEPLRVINNYLQLLERRHAKNLNEQAQNYIHRVINSANRMKNLIQDLLAYSRISTHKEPPKAISIESVLDQIKEDLEISIQETNAVITHDPLPSIHADELQITQLFLNLISNAIKYRSEQTPKIHISTSQTPTHWQINISDNGLGIDPEFFDRIFVIFQRLHGRDDYPGTGIGLAICKKIVERHKGTIWVESNLDQGSTFRFTIAKTIT